jgi:hypothetical protein
MEFVQPRTEKTMNLQFINAADLVGHWINGQADAGSGTRRGDVFNPAQGRVARQIALARAPTSIAPSRRHGRPLPTGDRRRRSAGPG